MRARLLVIFAVLVPFAAVSFGSARLADRGGQAIGAALAHAFVALPRAAPAERVELSATVVEAAALPEATPAPKARAKEARRREMSQGPSHGLYVRAPVVMRIARSGARPSGVLVPATGERPAGIALHGVGRLGVGLRDGDILTQVAGKPARSPEAVIATVIGAYRAHAKAVSGRFWRGGEPWSLVVEIPYPH